ncbi:hypothetical protein ACRRTK_019900 [Alexandromys fortis]
MSPTFLTPVIGTMVSRAHAPPRTAGYSLPFLHLRILLSQTCTQVQQQGHCQHCPCMFKQEPGGGYPSVAVDYEVP